MAPALISLLVGCGSPDAKVATVAASMQIENVATVMESIKDGATTNSFDPIMIEPTYKAARATGTQSFDAEDQSTDNWVIFDNTPAGATVRNVNLMETMSSL